MWDVHRNLDHGVLPPERTVLRFTFSDVPGAARDWWLLMEHGQAEVCGDDPGHPELATIESDLRTLTAVWRGDIAWCDATRAGLLTVRGPASVQRLVPRLLKLSAFAAVPRPA